MIPYRQILCDLEQVKIKEKTEEYKNNIIRPYLKIIRDNTLLRLRKGKKGRPIKPNKNIERDDINILRNKELKRVRKELEKKGRPKLIVNCWKDELYNEYNK